MTKTIQMSGHEVADQIAQVVTDNVVKSLRAFHTIHGAAIASGLVEASANSDTFIEAAIATFRKTQPQLSESIFNAVLQLIHRQGETLQ